MATRDQPRKPAPAALPATGEQPAARVGDAHTCVGNHAGGPVQTGSEDVKVNEVAFAHVQNVAKCSVLVDFLVTGSATVLVNGKPAARVGSKSAHGGKVVQGSPNVVVGGPSAGTTLGDPAAAKRACEAIKATRHAPNGPQSYNNCGVETARLLIQARNGAAPTEDGLVAAAVAGGNATGPQLLANGALNPAYGTTTVAGTDAILNNPANNLPSMVATQSWGTIDTTVGLGSGVITNHNGGRLWGQKVQGDHAVVTSGIDYDADGRVTGIHTADSGLNECDRVVAPDRYQRSLSGGQMNVTKGRLW